MQEFLEAVPKLLEAFSSSEEVKAAVNDIFMPHMLARSSALSARDLRPLFAALVVLGVTDDFLSWMNVLITPGTASIAPTELLVQLQSLLPQLSSTDLR